MTLLDKLSRPSREAAASLERFGATAQRLVTRVAGMTRAVTGLAGAVRELRAADTALERASGASGRLRGTMTGIGPAGSRAVTGLSAFTRAADRLATAAGKAADASTRLHTSFRPATTDSFVERENVALRENLKLLRDAAVATNRLSTAGNGRGGRRGLTGAGHGGGGVLPGLMLGLQGHGGGELKSVYEQATSLQDAIVKMHLNGLSDSEIARVRAKAEEVAATNKSTNPLTNINAIMEARLALGGDLNEAVDTAGEMAKLRTIVGFSLGKDRAKGAEDGVYDMLRTGEIRGLINDPARREELFRGMTAALIASNGRITPAQWHKTAIFGRSSTQGLSDQFEDYRLPFLMQELGGGKGGPAGTALQALFRAIPLATQKLSNIGEWRKLGLLDESKVDKDEKGHDKAIHPGAITLGSLAITDPDKAVYKLMDAMRANGITERGAMIQEFAQLVGTGTGQTAVDILGLQRGRMDNFERVLRQVEDSGTLFNQINATASQSVANLTAQMDALKGNIGSSVIPSFTNLVNAAARFVGIVDTGASIPGGNGNDPVSGRGALSATELAIVGGGAAVGLTKLVTRFPLLGKLMAGGAATAAASTLTGNPLAGALLGPSIAAVATRYLGRVPAIATRFLGMLPETMRTGIGGLKGYMATALMVDLVRNMPGVQHDERGQAFVAPAWDANRWAEDHLPTWMGGKPTPIAGARAGGGPVGAGKTYLVGERGPEFFTPGGSGAITSNTMLASMAGGSDGDTPKAIRGLSFVLASAVDGIARSLDRLAAHPAGGGIADDSGASTGGGGRRGFMSHMAGSHEPLATGRRGFMSRSGSGGYGVVNDGGAGLNGSNLDRAMALVKKKEGFIGHAKWDVNHYRLGYGSDTITNADGSVRSVQAGDTVDRAGADRDLARRIPIFQARLAKQVGESHWKALSPNAQAALTSVGYNYGGFTVPKNKTDYMKPLREAIASEDPHQIAKVVASFQGHNGGANRARRLEEAGLIERGGTAANPTASPTSSLIDKAATTSSLRGLRVANEQCVSLAKAAVGVTGSVKEWRRGVDAQEGTLKPGTPVATFLDRAGQQSARYAGGGTGTMGAHLDHAGVFQRYATDAAGKITGMVIAEQYKGSHGAHEKTYGFNNGRFGEANGSNYAATKGPNGEYLGGNRNAMNAVPDVLTRQAARRAAPAVEADAGQAAKAGAGGGHTTIHNTFHVHPGPGHDERKIADAVHRKFNNAAQAQYNDGVFA